MGIEKVFAWLAEFFDGQFLAILIATGVLFIIMFVTWWLYRTLSRRDVFSLYKKHGGMTYTGATTGQHIVYILKYFFVFPLYTFAGFVIFALSLFLLMKPATPEYEKIILFLSIVIISTIRVSAYVHEALAEDLAKLLPLSLLSVLLTHPTFDGIGITFDQINAFFTLIPGFLKYLVFTILLEGVLRGSTWLFSNMKDEHDE